MITKEMITKAQEHHKRVKYNSALLLTLMSMGLLAYSAIMMCITSDIDFCTLFCIASVTSYIGLRGILE